MVNTQWIDPVGRRFMNVSFVKMYDPGCIILDVPHNDRSMEEEIEYTKAVTDRLTKHWEVHGDDPIEGRIFLPGEVVAVNLGDLWRAAMIVNFKYVEGLHHYDLILLDTGQIVEVHRMTFRKLCNGFMIKPRYILFRLMDLFPYGDERSAYSSWSVDACNDLNSLLDMASSLSIDVMARLRTPNYEHLFGNIYVHKAKHVINVKDRLLKSKAAVEDPEAFKCVFHILDRDILHEQKIVPNHMQNPEVIENEQGIEITKNVPDHVQKPEVLENEQGIEITDETLDRHLPTFWRVGGSDPLAQNERESIRRRLIKETYIGFSHALHEETTDSALNNHLDESSTTGNCDFSHVERENCTSLDRGRQRNINGKHKYYGMDEFLFSQSRRLNVSHSAGDSDEEESIRSVKESVMCQESPAGDESVTVRGKYKQRESVRGKKYPFRKDETSEDESLEKCTQGSTASLDTSFSKIPSDFGEVEVEVIPEVVGMKFLGISTSSESEELENYVLCPALRNEIASDCEPKEEVKDCEQSVSINRVLSEYCVEVVSKEDAKKLSTLWK